MDLEANASLFCELPPEMFEMVLERIPFYEARQLNHAHKRKAMARLAEDGTPLYSYPNTEPYRSRLERYDTPLRHAYQLQSRDLLAFIFAHPSRNAFGNKTTEIALLNAIRELALSRDWTDVCVAMEPWCTQLQCVPLWSYQGSKICWATATMRTVLEERLRTFDPAAPLDVKNPSGFPTAYAFMEAWNVTEYNAATNILMDYPEFGLLQATLRENLQLALQFDEVAAFSVYWEAYLDMWRIDATCTKFVSMLLDVAEKVLRAQSPAVAEYMWTTYHHILRVQLQLATAYNYPRAIQLHDAIYAAVDMGALTEATVAVMRTLYSDLRVDRPMTVISDLERRLRQVMASNDHATVSAMCSLRDFHTAISNRKLLRSLLILATNRDWADVFEATLTHPHVRTAHEYSDLPFVDGYGILNVHSPCVWECFLTRFFDSYHKTDEARADVLDNAMRAVLVTDGLAMARLVFKKRCTLRRMVHAYSFHDTICNAIDSAFNCPSMRRHFWIEQYQALLNWPLTTREARALRAKVQRISRRIYPKFAQVARRYLEELNRAGTPNFDDNPQVGQIIDAFIQLRKVEPE